jgi:hypothetical protein
MMISSFIHFPANDKFHSSLWMNSVHVCIYAYIYVYMCVYMCVYVYILYPFIKSTYNINTCTLTFIVAPFTIVKLWNQPNPLSFIVLRDYRKYSISVIGNNFIYMIMWRELFCFVLGNTGLELSTPYLLDKACVARSLPLEPNPWSFSFLVCFSHRILHFCLGQT